MAFGSGFRNDPFGSKSWRRIAASIEGDTTDIEEVWSGYDPALEPIEARVVREWEEEGYSQIHSLFHRAF